MSVAAISAPARSPAWKWWVCGLLLLATMINYMDRLTLNLTSLRIMREFSLDERDYGQLESGFAFAFALGAIITGWLADRWNVRWLYPAAVLIWSVAGFATGLVSGFTGLLICRFLLGLAEAGNWPCALRTTQRILPPAQRSLGNGILQSGAAIGAVVTPMIVLALVTGADARHLPEWAAGALGRTLADAQSGAPPGASFAAWAQPLTEPGAWRSPFLVVGAVGVTWVLVWLLSVRREDLRLAHVDRGPSLASVLGWLVALLALDVTVRVLTANQAALSGLLRDAVTSPWLPLTIKAAVSILGVAGVVAWLLRVTRDEDALPRPLFVRRFVALMVLVVSINTTWHYFRAWLPLFLQKQHHYPEVFTGQFLTAYYIATDVGSLTAGFAALALARAGFAVHRSRVAVFLTCAVLTTLSLGAAFLPAGYALLGVLLVIGFGALGLFPIYYSFSQELTVRHQGKLTGALGCINWLAMYLLHEVVGESIKQTGSYAQGMALAGFAPLVGVAALFLLWGKTPVKAESL